jgi:DNA repair ATPase RecN
VVAEVHAGRQVLCITQLPEPAGYGDAHDRIEKEVTGGCAVTPVRPVLTTEERVGEPASMWGRELGD